MTEGPKKEIEKNTSAGPVDDDSINNEGSSNDHDDEFVSDLHQAHSPQNLPLITPLVWQ